MGRYKLTIQAKGELAGCLGMLFLIAIIVVVFVCLWPEPKKPVSQEAVDWVEQFYKEFPIGGGWITLRPEADGHKIVVRVLLPPEQAQAVMAMPSRDQFRIIQVACPGPLEDIWTMLDREQDIEIQASAVVPGREFIDAPCRLKIR